MLKKSEIEEAFSEHSFNKDSDATTGATLELIGDEWEKFYNLNTHFSVFYYPLENYYGVVGSASWKAELVTPFESNKAAEEFNLDYISFTWVVKIN